jgi:hypothetical protein
LIGLELVKLPDRCAMCYLAHDFDDDVAAVLETRGKRVRGSQSVPKKLAMAFYETRTQRVKGRTRRRGGWCLSVCLSEPPHNY